MNRCSPLLSTCPLCLQSHTIDMSVFPSGPLYISLYALCLHITVSLFLCIPSQLLFLRDIYIKPQLSSDPTDPCEPYLLTELLTRHRFSATCIPLKHGLGWVQLSDMAMDVFQRSDQKWPKDMFFAPQHMLCTLFCLLPPCHLSQVPSLTYCINF